jgi:alpha-1,2-mannosyltransferase
MSLESRYQRNFLIGLVLLFVAISIQYSIKVMTPKRDGQTASAVLRWANQIQRLDDGEDVHRTLNYPNPPIMALILLPISELAQVSPLIAALTWFYLKVFMTVLAILWTFRMLETSEAPFPPWAKALTILLSIRPIIGDLSHGNVNLFILFLVVGSLYAFNRERDLLAGILLALAIACKVTPAMFLAYFLWKRAWKVLISVIIGLFLFFIVVPSGWLGWEGNMRSLSSWFDGMVKPFLFGTFVTPEHSNQSLPGLLTRLLTENPSSSTYIADQYTPIRYHNLAEFTMPTIKRLNQLVMGLFAICVMLTFRTSIRQGRQKPALVAEYALIMIGMLLFSERTWKHHCVTLLVPFAVICHALAQRIPTRDGLWPDVAGTWKSGLWLITGIGLSIGLMSLTSTGMLGEDPPKLHEVVESTALIGGPTLALGMSNTGILTDSPAKLAQVYGAYTFAFLILISMLFWLLRLQLEKSASPGQSGTEANK